MSYTGNSIEQHGTNLTNPKDIGCPSVKRTPLQTLSPNSPSLLLRSRGSSKRQSADYDKFFQFSQSTPLYRPDGQCPAIMNPPHTPANTVPSTTYSNLSEVSLDSFSFSEEIVIPEVINSVPSVGQIEMQDESFEIHKDMDGSNSSRDICSTCDDSFLNKTDNKENHDVPEYFYEDVSSDDNDDFLFHSRNNNSKIFLVPPLESDLQIEILDDVEVAQPPSTCRTSSSNASMCQTFSSNLSEFHISDSSLSEGQTSSSQFGDNEESDDAAFFGNATAENNVNYSVEKELAFAGSLEQLQYLINNGMFLDSPTDDPRFASGSLDGFIPATLQAYEPEEGETDYTGESSVLQYDEDETSDDDDSDTSGSSSESLSPGEIGSSLFSDNCSICSSSDSNTSLNQDDDLKTEIHNIVESSSTRGSSSSGYYNVDTTSSDKENKDIDTGTDSPENSPEYFKDHERVFDDLLADMVEPTSGSTGIQSGDPLLINVVGRHNAQSSTSGENLSLKVHADSLTYQNEVDIWDCHAFQNDLVDYFGASSDTNLKVDFTETDLLPDATSFDLQQDLKDILEPTGQPGEIFETLNHDNPDSNHIDSNKDDLNTSDNLLDCVIENFSFCNIVSEENVEKTSEPNKIVPDLTDHSYLNPCCDEDEFSSLTDDQRISYLEIQSKENTSSFGTSSVVNKNRLTDGTDNPAHGLTSVENLGYVHSESSEDGHCSDFNQDEWDNISYNEECLHENPKVLVNDNFVSCTEEVSLIGTDDENQTAKPVTAVHNKRSFNNSKKPATLKKGTQSAKWSCTVL